MNIRSVIRKLIGRSPSGTGIAGSRPGLERKTDCYLQPQAAHVGFDFKADFGPSQALGYRWLKNGLNLTVKLLKILPNYSRKSRFFRRVSLVSWLTALMWFDGPTSCVPNEAARLFSVRVQQSGKRVGYISRSRPPRVGPLRLWFPLCMRRTISRSQARLDSCHLATSAARLRAKARRASSLAFIRS